MTTSSGRLSNNHKAILAVVVAAGLAVTALIGQSAQQATGQSGQTYAESEADRLAATFALLLDSSRAPLQSVATLFNGSGRVAAEEFTGTIESLKKQSGAYFPPAMAFITRSNPSSCDKPDGCWLVAYSTETQGLLNPGSDLSRFAPTASTIDAALAEQGVMKIGAPFREANSDLRSFLAVTIKNTRQFGVIVSLIDYQALAKRMKESWLPQGVALRISAAFPGSAGLTPPQAVFGDEKASAANMRTVTRSVESDGAKFTLSFDFDPQISGDSAAAMDRIIAGLVITLLVTALVGWLLRRS